MTGYDRQDQHDVDGEDIRSVMFESEYVNLAQDELLPGEERKMPPQLNILGYRHNRAAHV